MQLTVRKCSMAPLTKPEHTPYSAPSNSLMYNQKNHVLETHKLTLHSKRQLAAKIKYI